MKFPWPPSEDSGFEIVGPLRPEKPHETTPQKKTKENTFFLPVQKQDTLLLAVRIKTNDLSSITLTIPVGGQKAFHLTCKHDEWTMLPYPIESHAIGAVWTTFEMEGEGIYSIDLGYYPWKTRSFRMRCLINDEREILLAYRINKNGQTICYLPPVTSSWKLPEDSYFVPKTSNINQESILLLSAQSEQRIKKVPESRYFVV